MTEENTEETTEETAEATTEETSEESTEETSETGDSANTEETETSETNEENGEGETPEQKIERLEKTNKSLHARLKKKPKPTNKTKESVTPLLEEKLTLIAQGENKDVIREAMEIAKSKDISLEEAMKTPVMTAFKKEIIAEEKSKKAALGASGGGAQKTESEFKSGQTRDEHKKAWDKKFKFKGKG